MIPNRQARPPVKATQVPIHLGLGDAILCNALLRELAGRYGGIVTYAKPHNIVSVRAMLRDANVAVVEVRDDLDMIEKIDRSAPVIPIGFERLDRTIAFDRSFYRLAGVDFDKRWTGFRLPRDLFAETALANRLELYGGFTFVHDDIERGYRIEGHRLPAKRKVFRPYRGGTDNIFDYTMVLERAKEIHCIDSSFLHLCESIPELAAKTTFHRYARPTLVNDLATLRNIKRTIQ